MTQPRLISVVPGFGDSAGGDSITIAGKDIDPAATVDFRPAVHHPSQTLIPAVVTGIKEFPNTFNVQHLTVTTPVIPIVAGFYDRTVAIRVTNPPYGEYDEIIWHARELLDVPTFTEVGTVLFKPERLNESFGDTALHPTFTHGSNLWRHTFEFTADGSGDVAFKAINPLQGNIGVAASTQGYHPNPSGGPAADGSTATRKTNYFGPFITRGIINRVVLDTPTGSPAAGAAVTYLDDTEIDVFGGGIVMPAVGSPTDFVPLVDDQKVALNDWMEFNVSGASAGGTGIVHIYFTALP